MMNRLNLDHLEARARARRVLPVPERARELRRAAGVTLSEFAEILGISARTLGYWEAGDRRPRGEHLELYSDALAVLARGLRGAE